MTIRRAITIVSILLALMAPAGSIAQEPVTDPRMDEAERIYRTEGPAQAMPEFQRLLTEFEQAGDKRSVAITHTFIGAMHWRLGNYEEARQALDTSLELKQALGDPVQVGKTLNLLGLVAWDLGEFEVAVGYFEQAGGIGRQAGDARLEGVALNNLSLVHDELGDYRTSLAQYQQVLELYSQIDFPRGRSETLGNIGGVHLLLGRFTEAEGYYRLALELSEQLESTVLMSQDHGNLGLAYNGMGRTDLALHHFETALALAEQAGLEKERGQWLRGLGNARIMEGRYDLGLEAHRAAVEALESSGAQVQLLDAMHDIGLLYLTLGDPESAERYFQQTITLAREMGMPRIVTINLLALGDLQYRHQRLAEAEALYAQAGRRAEEAGETAYHGAALLRQASVQRDLGQFAEGERAGRLALKIARETGSASLEVEALYMLGELERVQGNVEVALDQYRSAGKISTSVGDPNLQWKIAFGRGLALEQSGDVASAIDALEAAIKVIENVRNRLQEKRFRAGYLQDKHQVYIELVRMQMELSRASDAFQTAERLRAWTYTEQTGGEGLGDLTLEQQRSRDELRERIRRLQRNLEDERSRTVPERRQMAINTFSAELALAEREFQSLVDDIASQQAGIVRPERLEHESALRVQLREDEALIEYVVGEDNLTLFVLTEEEFHATSIETGQNNLHSRLELLRNLLEQRGNDRWKAPADSLARTLLQPALDAGWLAGVEHLYLVPHGMLNYLPFAVLPVEIDGEQRPVIEHFTLAYLPAATSLAEGSNTDRQTPNVLALAPEATRLEHAPEEVRSIGQLYGAQAELLLGAEATESQFKDKAGEFRILHLATHGYFNKLNPLLSGLQLEADDTNDGLLEVHEILELRLESELVTLSACKTGLGSGYFSAVPAGDDFVGMTRAFLQVGSASVLATLWEVEDRSTVDLMKSFYGYLDNGNGGQTKAGALASAQRALLASQDYEHPYYWAPFVVVGSMSHDRGARG